MSTTVHAVRSNNAVAWAAHIRVPSELGSYFGARKAVSPLEFELVCRTQLHAQLDRMKWDALRKEFEKEVFDYHTRLLALAERRPISDEEIVRRVREYCRETFLRHQQELDVRIEWVERGAKEEEAKEKKDAWEW